MEKSFIILYGWKEPWGRLQKVLLKEDEESEKLLPNKYDILEIDEKEGEIIFDIDRLGLEWDCFGIVLRNDPPHESTIPIVDAKENVISRKNLDDLDRKLIEYLRDKPDLLEYYLENQNYIFGRIPEDFKFLYMERLSYVYNLVFLLCTNLSASTWCTESTSAKVVKLIESNR